jgi:predicted transcriptional regulator
MSKKQVVEIDDSDIHKLRKYGVISFGYNVTLKYVKAKLSRSIEVVGGVIE